MKILIIFIVSFSALVAKSEIFNLDFKIQCLLAPSIPNSYFYVQTVLKLSDSNEKKLYQIQCWRDSKKCMAVELRLSDKEIGMMSLVPQSFEVNTINISATSATFVYNNVTYTVDTKDNKVKMMIFHKTTELKEKDLEERWEGNCK